MPAEDSTLSYFDAHMRHLLIIAYDFPPRGGGGVQRTLKFAKYLPEFGWNVTVVCPDWTGHAGSRTDDGFLGQLPPDVTVVTTGSPPPDPLKPLWRIVKRLPRGWKVLPQLKSNFAYPDHAGPWSTPAFDTASTLLQRGQYDALYTTSPPATAHCVGLKLKTRFNLPWVVDLRDPWSDNPLADGRMWRWRRRIDRALERRVLEAADVIIANTEANRSSLLRRHSLGPEKVVTIPNGYDEADFADYPPTPPADRFRVTFAGAAYAGYNPSPVVEAYQRFVARGDRRDAVMTLAGTCCRWARESLPHEWLARYVELRGYVEHREIPQLLSASHIVATVNPLNTAHCVPGKVYELLRSRRHILAACDPGSEVERILEKTNAGAAFAFHDVDGMAAFIEQRYQEWKERGGYVPPQQNEPCVGEYDRRRQTGRLAGLIDNLQSRAVN